MSTSRRSKPRFKIRNRRFPGGRRGIILLVGASLFFLCLCSVITVAVGRRVADTLFPDNTPSSEATSATPSWAPDSAELTIAVSPVMATTMEQLAEQFNAQKLETADGHVMKVTLLTLAPEKIVEQSVTGPSFQAISPDSSLWLTQIDQRWADLQGSAGEGIPLRRVGESIRYAVSPIVIAAWESTARELGWPDQPIGWQDIQRKATQDPSFKWNHPSTSHAAGLLATLAEFYAGAGITRNLTADLATAPHVLEYVRAVEATVSFYGEGEDVIIQRLTEEGRNYLDAFVAQEQTVIAWNQSNSGEKLVAIYPAEGTLWTDHPLALLELGVGEELAVTDNQRLTFRAFAGHLTSDTVQRQLLAAGYRPADLAIELESPGSPFAGTSLVDWRQPQTTLQLPSGAVVDVVQNVWWYTKRPTNVYLVVDTSGSMAGAKLERTRTALRSFIEQIRGDKDRVGLVEFGSGVKHFEPLRTVNQEGRDQLLQLVDRMNADGDTALLDAVGEAYNDLVLVNDQQAINAIVVMTDGQENDSSLDLSDLRRMFQRPNGVPVVVFTIAFGDDADEELLQELARIGNGQFRRASETDIEELYKIISTYF